MLASIRFGTIAHPSTMKDCCTVYTRSSVLLRNLAYPARERKERLCLRLFPA